MPPIVVVVTMAVTTIGLWATPTSRLVPSYKAVNTNPLTASADDRALVERQQAGNKREQAKTIAGLRLTAVQQSTRSHRSVECRCIRCHATYESELTIPRDEVGHYDRRIEVFRVENGKRVGDVPLYVVANKEAAMTKLNANSSTMKKILEGSEDGGLLKKRAKKRTEDLWIRYEKRLPNMIVAPRCKVDGCQKNTEPTERKLRARVDYVTYLSLYQKWRKEEETKLRTLCESLGIIVEKGATKTALLAKLKDHYNPKQQ